MKLSQVIEDAPAGATATGAFARVDGPAGALVRRPSPGWHDMVWDADKQQWVKRSSPPS